MHNYLSISIIYTRSTLRHAHQSRIVVTACRPNCCGASACLPRRHVWPCSPAAPSRVSLCAAVCPSPRAGLDYVRCVSGGTFWPPAYTGILKHVVRTGVAGRLPSSAPTSASPTSAMGHLLHYARNGVSPVEPSPHAGPSEEALPDPAKLPFYGQTHEEVEGTGGAPLSFSRRPRELECTETPGNVPEGEGL